jgi:hypothetical protein
MSLRPDQAPEVTGHLLLFRKADWAEQGFSDNEIRTVMERVNAWFDELSASGTLLGGQPLMECGAVVCGDSVTDGPFAEAKESVGGYVLLSVRSFEEAVAIARSNPMNAYGLVTEVRPTASNCPSYHRLMSRPEAALS